MGRKNNGRRYNRFTNGQNRHGGHNNHDYYGCRDSYNDLFHNHKIKGQPTTVDIKCTIEELYHGKNIKYKIKRKVYNGSILTYEDKIIEISIEPGWKDGTKIIFLKMGDEGPNITPGNLIFIVKQIEHNIYKRDVDNLIIENCPITLKESLIGFSRTLKTLNGKTKVINVLPLNSTNEYYTIKGVGMPIRKQKKMIGYGDLIIKFYINMKGIDKHKKNKLIKILNE